ncbi:MAG: rhomboid family intramembrane serine protease [gamma proteobacterium symbiont of Taylorina sp.]|nr:rhomboid family intramembrane serine protease [gamma proteobacterium symbiont of Taylorina sp.]
MLMLLPLDKKIDWKYPPVVTLLLIIINAIIFYSMQSSDDAIEVNAAKFYLDSGLSELEAQVYPKYLESQDDKQLLYKYDMDTGVIGDESSPYYSEYVRAYTDRDFGYKQALTLGTIINVSKKDIKKIQKKRQLYLLQLSNSTFRNYSLRPAETSLITLFSHMFLHADDGHLWGNMLFLLLVGYVVEAILGSWLFLLAYLLTGLGASVLDILFHSMNYNFHLGASGAISGVMGMYATLFGRRKIQFFYNILFWVGRVKAPAIIMLFIWMAKELIQMIAVDSNVNFLAHLGGLISGAIIALLLLRLKDRVNVDYMDLAEKTQQRAKLMSNGIQYLGMMKLDNAKHCFKKVLQQVPEDIEAIEYLYKASQSDPASNDYHKYAKKLIFASIKINNFELMYRTWKSYNELAEPTVKLEFNSFYHIFEQLLHYNRIEDAERLIICLFNNNPQKNELSAGFLKLAKKYLNLNNKHTADKYSKVIIKYFPNSSEVSNAESILSSGKLPSNYGSI